MFSPRITTICFFLATASPLAAQGTHSLLFSPRGPEESRSGSGGTVLRILQPRSVANVTPQPGCNQSAEKFAPAIGWQTLIGDEDNDGDAHTPDLMRAIDAVLVKPYERDPNSQLLVARSSPVNWFDVYVSPKRAVGTFVSGAPGLRPGDCGTYVRTSAAGNGQVRYFIRAEQIITAFGILDPQTQQQIEPHQLNLDAITVDGDRNIFLSFEDNHMLQVTVAGVVVLLPLTDGGVAWLPPGAWTPNGRGNVGTVMPMSGRIALSEFAVDGLVAAAGPADQAGACPSTIGDTDGLAIDPNGGGFTVNWNGVANVLPNLLFAGETLTGGCVLTTAAGGSIAVVNGCPLATACGAGAVTDGTAMGLNASGTVNSLDGLVSLNHEPCRFVIGSSTPLGLGGPIVVDIGTNLPFPLVALGVGFGTPPISPSIDFAAWFANTQCFPELYNVTPVFLLPLGADGFGDFTASFTAVAPFVPGGLLFQAAGIHGGSVHLSSPATIH